jgi:hypothetical protein
MARPNQGTLPPGLVWAQVAPSHASSSHVGSQVKILMPEIASLNLSSGTSMKHQNTQNRCFLLCRVITKMSVIDGKFPYINAKHHYNIIYHLNMLKYAKINYKVYA